MTLTSLRRLASVDRDELRFRLTCIARHALDRTRSALAAPVWDRRDLAGRLSSYAPAAAREALQQHRWADAHARFAEHFATRPSAFPLQAQQVPALAVAIHQHFPKAANEAASRAAKIIAGKYDVLGYRDVTFGTPPDWHADPVNNACAPRLFWSSVPYLSPECGDHKVIWEINRHQHWIALGRSRILNNDRNCYTTFVAQLEDWVTQNPPLLGVNWASMLELGFRGISWLWALNLFSADARQDTPDDAPWTVDLLLALDRQLTHVEQNLSRYFSPNTHLTGEALALYVAGHALPELASSGRRVQIGREILLQEIERQIHEDGGHAELSTHYHRYTTDFYLLALLVARAAADPAAVTFENAAHRLAHYLRSVSDDTGSLPLLGDDDGGQMFDVSGRAPSSAASTLAIAAAALDDDRLATGPLTEEVLWLCGPAAASKVTHGRASSWPSTALPHSGYYVLRNREGDHLVLDAGQHGFLNRGHAHADALSLVLTLRRTPLFVDPGAGLYTVDPILRDRFRSTAMHNTVVLDGKSQAEPRGSFHWHSRVDAKLHAWRLGSGFGYVEGSHDAYAPLRHTRAVLALDGVGWFIFDHVLGEGRLSTEAFWHLGPNWSVAMTADRIAALRHRSGLRTAVATTAGQLRLLEPGDPSALTLFAPAYGRIVETHVLTTREPMDFPASFATFVAADPSMAQDLRVRAIPTSGPANGEWQTMGVELAFEGGVATALCAVSRAAEPIAAAPGTTWGAEGLRTNGRAAAIVRRAAAPLTTVVVDGSFAEPSAGPLATSAPILEPITCARN